MIFFTEQVNSCQRSRTERMDRHVITVFLSFTNRMGTHGSSETKPAGAEWHFVVVFWEPHNPSSDDFHFPFELKDYIKEHLTDSCGIWDPFQRQVGIFWKCPNGIQNKFLQIWCLGDRRFSVMSQCEPGWVWCCSGSVEKHSLKEAEKSMLLISASGKLSETGRTPSCWHSVCSVSLHVLWWRLFKPQKMTSKAGYSWCRYLKIVH